MKHQAPAFQMYANDRLAMNLGLSLPAVGAEHLLELNMWTQSTDQCSMVDDDERIARIVGTSIDEWKRLRLEIQHPGRPIFEEKNGRLISPYLRQEAAKQRKYRKSQSEKGKKSAELRLNRGSTVVEPEHQPEGNSSSSLSSSYSSAILVKKEKTKTSAHRSDVLNGHRVNFEIFWKRFPKKRSKGQAEKAWAKLQPDDVLLGMMLSKIDQASRTSQWTKDRGEFIPNPASWLNAKGWEDEYAEPRINGHGPSRICTKRPGPQPEYTPCPEEVGEALRRIIPGWGMAREDPKPNGPRQHEETH